MTGLGVFDRTDDFGGIPFNSSARIRLWNSVGTVLADVVVVASAATDEQWLFGDVGLYLYPGTYIIGAQVTDAMRQLTTITTASFLTYLGPRVGYATSTNPTCTTTGLTICFPDEVGNANSYFGPTIEFADSSAVPLPAALPLFASGASLLGFLGLRRKKRLAKTAM